MARSFPSGSALNGILLRKLIANGVPGKADSLFKTGRMVPSQAMQAGYVHQFTRSAVRLRNVENQLAIETKNPGNDFSQFADGDIFSGADIDERRLISCEEGVVTRIVKGHQKQTGLR